MTADPSTLNCGIESSQIVAMVTSNIYNGLIHMDEESNPHPDLAQSWDISPDGLVYTFQLRDNVKWHDGQPLTSADVKYQLRKFGRQVQRPRPRSVSQYQIHRHPQSNNGEDHSQKTLFAVSRSADRPRRLHHAQTSLRKYRRVQKSHNNNSPVGSGPFKFKEWSKGSHITLVRNENYFKKGRPFLDSVVYRIIPNASTRAIAFETGEINAIFASNNFPYQHIDRLKKLPNAVIKDIGSPSLIGVNFNFKGNPALAKREVRVAFAHAIDKKFIVEKGLRGVGKVIDSVIPPGISWAYNPNVPKYPFDLKKANALLDEAGYPRTASGTRFSLSSAFEAGNDNSERPVQILREQLKAAGIDIKLERLERSVMMEKVFQKYDFDLWFGPLTTRGHPALGTARLYATSSITGQAFTNFTRYSNPQASINYSTRRWRRPNGRTWSKPIMKCKTSSCTTCRPSRSPTGCSSTSSKTSFAAL